MKRIITCIVAVVALCVLVNFPADAQLRTRKKALTGKSHQQRQIETTSQQKTRRADLSIKGTNANIKFLKDLKVSTREELEKKRRMKEELAKGVGIKDFKSAVRLELPFVSKQYDGWSCGLHTATRLLKYKGYDVSYEALRKQRQIVSLTFNSDEGPGTLPPALERILRQWHDDSWVLLGVDFNVLKNLLRQKKPVGVLIWLKGKYVTIKIGDRKIKAPVTHWVVVSGFDDKTKTIYYYDPYEEDEQHTDYDSFLEVWAFDPYEFIKKGFDPLLLTYGFIASRTAGFCN